MAAVMLAKQTLGQHLKHQSTPQHHTMEMYAYATQMFMLLFTSK